MGLTGKRAEARCVGERAVNENDGWIGTTHGPVTSLQSLNWNVRGKLLARSGHRARDNPCQDPGLPPSLLDEPATAV